MLQRGRGLAVEKRQAPAIEIAMAGMTPPPRSKEGTHPGRFSHVRNAETPTESGPLRWPGRPTVRNGGILLAEQVRCLWLLLRCDVGHPPTCTTGRRLTSFSAWRRISRVTG